MIIEEGWRSELPDSDFGIPSLRKYPIHDKKHVHLAITMFNRVEKKYEKELAENIIKKIHEFKMEDEITYSEKNRFFKYYTKSRLVAEISVITNLKNSIKEKKIAKSSISKQDVLNSIKEVEKMEYDSSTKERIKWDIVNAIATATLAVPSAIGIASGNIFIIPVGVLGIYLSSLVNTKMEENYRKDPYLTKLKNKITAGVVKLEEYSKNETDPEVKRNIESRVSEGKKCLALINKSLKTGDPNKVEKPKAKDPWDFDDDFVFEATDISGTEKLNPVFLVLSYTETLFGKIERKVVKTHYTHASMGFDVGLNQLYSFNFRTTDGKPGGGFSYESLREYIGVTPNAEVLVLTIFLKNRDFNRLKNNIRHIYIENRDLSVFDIPNIFRILRDKPKDTDYSLKMICSQFVDNMLKLINVDLTGKESNLVTPDDLAKIDNPKVYKIFEGKAVDYDLLTMKNRLKEMSSGAIAIKEMFICEVKEFPVQFNDEGDMLIKNWKSIDFEAEYRKSTRILKIYKQNENYDAMAYEVSKLWFFNTILEKKLSSKRISDEDRVKYTQVRAKILTDFSVYLKILTRVNSDFNFSTYYDESPFSDATIKIKGSTIKGTINIIKQILK